jgi:hypothetical protein
VRSRLLVAAVLVAGFALTLYAAVVATSGPRPAHARKAIATVVSRGAGRTRAVVSVPDANGNRIESELRTAARRYEEFGPVNVLVVDATPPRVYDANGRPHRGWWVISGLGILVVLSTVCGQRCVRVVVHRAAVKP